MNLPLTRLLLCLFFCTLLPASSFAFEVSDLQGQEAINSELTYFIDESESATIEGFQASNSTAHFHPANNGIINFGPMAKPIWYRLTLTNQSDQAIAKVITTGFLEANHWVYKRDREGGPFDPIPLREQRSWAAAFNIEVAPQSSETLFFKIKVPEGGSHIRDFSIFDPGKFAIFDREYRVNSIVYYSALFTIGIYNLFLFSTLYSTTVRIESMKPL